MWPGLGAAERHGRLRAQRGDGGTAAEHGARPARGLRADHEGLAACQGGLGALSLHDFFMISIDFSMFSNDFHGFCPFSHDFRCFLMCFARFPLFWLVF